MFPNSRGKKVAANLRLKLDLQTEHISSQDIFCYVPRITKLAANVAGPVIPSPWIIPPQGANRLQALCHSLISNLQSPPAIADLLIPTPSQGPSGVRKAFPGPDRPLFQGE